MWHLLYERKQTSRVSGSRLITRDIYSISYTQTMRGWPISSDNALSAHLCLDPPWQTLVMDVQTLGSKLTVFQVKLRVQAGKEFVFFPYITQHFLDSLQTYPQYWTLSGKSQRQVHYFINNLEDEYRTRCLRLRVGEDLPIDADRKWPIG